MTRVYIIIFCLVVASGAGYFLIQQIQNTGRLEHQIEILEENLDTRRQIDEAVRNSPNDRDGSIRVLEQFLSDN